MALRKTRTGGHVVLAHLREDDWGSAERALVRAAAARSEEGRRMMESTLALVHECQEPDSHPESGCECTRESGCWTSPLDEGELEELARECDDAA